MGALYFCLERLFKFSRILNNMQQYAHTKISNISPSLNLLVSHFANACLKEREGAGPLLSLSILLSHLANAYLEEGRFAWREATSSVSASPTGLKTIKFHF